MRLREIKTFKGSCVYKNIENKVHIGPQKTHTQKRPKNALILLTSLFGGYHPPSGASQQRLEEVSFFNAQYSIEDHRAYKETGK